MGTLFWIKGLILKIFSSLFLRKGTMAAEFSSHSFQNRLPDYDASTTGVPFDSLVFRKYIEELVKSTLDEYPSSKDKEKPTIYTGLGGVSLMFLEIHRYNQQCVEQEKENEKISLPKKKVPLFYARYFLDLAKKKVERMGWTPSFICGAPGLAALEIAIQVEENTFQSSGSTEHLLSLADYCKRRQEKVVCNEHLYGRSGYLFSLLYAQSASKVDLSSSATASSVLSLIFEDGLDGAKQFQKENKRNIMEEWGGEDRSPLLFSWHDKYYLGAAHGMSGIMFTLLDFPLSEHQMDLVKDSIVYMLNHCRFASGNYCSKMYQSKEAKYDRLVQWCHGATGFVILFCKAFRVFGEDRFYQAAERAGEVIWKRGLLEKGPGLCHGVSGNGFTFLSLYEMTKDEKWVHRARQFGLFEIEKKKELNKRPDRPFSLFEGTSGAICFFLSLLNPEYPIHFPGFSTTRTTGSKPT